MGRERERVGGGEPRVRWRAACIPLIMLSVLIHLNTDLMPDTILCIMRPGRSARRGRLVAVDRLCELSGGPWALITTTSVERLQHVRCSLLGSL